MQRVKSPWLDGDSAKATGLSLGSLGIRGGVWDKRLHRMYGTCRRLEDARALKDIVGGDKFSIWGYSSSTNLSRKMCLAHILDTAMEAGLFKDMLEHESLPTFLKVPDWQERLVDVNMGRCMFTPPSLFSILKWKSDPYELGVLKWRDVVSFAGHPLRKWAKLVSRCIQLLVREVGEVIRSFCLPTMVGVRDLLGCMARTNPQWSNSVGAEMDMDDMFWQIPKDEVIPSLTYLAKKLKGRRTGETWFTLDRIGDKKLDRMGKAPEKTSISVSLTEVLRYVEWDVFSNTLFVVHTLVLNQGAKGVPIGGFISAQLAEAWCMYKEHLSLF
jgi:hypothetical protein